MSTHVADGDKDKGADTVASPSEPFRLSSLSDDDDEVDFNNDSHSISLSSAPPSPPLLNMNLPPPLAISIPPSTENTWRASPLSPGMFQVRDEPRPASVDAGGALGSPPAVLSPTILSPVPSSLAVDVRNVGREQHPTPLVMPIGGPRIRRVNSETASIASTSSYARKTRPESVLLDTSADGPLIIGIALVDFNHLVGPKIELVHPPTLAEDEEMCKILPFLALPDGAHLTSEDYSYFHIVPSKTPNPKTIFGISCNRQIAAADLLSKEADVTRSTVQKAVVVLASKPLFGPIRDKLGVVTRAFFNQRDFRETSILYDFYAGLEVSLRSQLTESGVYMGERELVYKFRHRSLTLLKLLLLQKKIMFFGHPVERLCTYQYSLVSLIPGLLLALEDCGSPPLNGRASTLTRATELKTSDRKSLITFMGLPLNIFGKDSFFQPYLPLQQVDMLKTGAFLCGTTNSIVTQQRDSGLDLLVNIETNTFEFKDTNAERLAALTPADRKWMDDIVRDVKETWNELDPERPINMQFKGSDDYLRAKFEDYICSALSCVRYAEFMSKGNAPDAHISGTSGDPNFLQNFGEAWISAFRQTNAFEVWDRITDPSIFDIIEPRHPCDGKPTAVSDIGLRLAESIHELKIEQNLAPTREVLSNAWTTGSTTIFKAFDAARTEVAARIAAQRAAAAANAAASGPSAPAGASNPALPTSPGGRESTLSIASTLDETSSPTKPGLRPFSLGARPPLLSPTSSAALLETTQAAKATLGSWGAGIGSFINSKAATFRRPTSTQTSTTPIVTTPIEEDPVIVTKDLGKLSESDHSPGLR
ncbi:hypothetical protein BOTBODRAFT_151915 [Botryobasidium botryosum FD-172 SS1]|uniref:UDENN domain-containing protein n=1 Tax=Botryobasidium botryosum (strain FD-172 SS1) TaxID=930990 RepID=A0A067NB01_BOTB1|nr:hypothetical protein BOTBODRAFT_151915 [Botryobasidium botryosum FD-172 SS1]